MGHCLFESCTGLLLVLADASGEAHVSRRPIPFDLIDVLLMAGLAVVVFAPHVLVSHRIAAILKNPFASSDCGASRISWIYVATAVAYVCLACGAGLRIAFLRETTWKTEPMSRWIFQCVPLVAYMCLCLYLAYGTVRIAFDDERRGA